MSTDDDSLLALLPDPGSAASTPSFPDSPPQSPNDTDSDPVTNALLSAVSPPESPYDSVADPTLTPAPPPVPAGPVHSTPVKPTINDPYKAPGYNAKVQVAMGMHFVEDPYDHFMESFATPKNTTSPDLPKKQLASAALKLKGLLDGKKEEPMYAHSCASFNEAIATQSAHKYVFKDVSSHQESGQDDLKIDIAMYDCSSEARAAYELPARKDSDDVARTAWAWMKCGIEVKYNSSISAFSFDGSSPFLRPDTEAQAQIAKYATEMMSRQHRTFVFVIYIWRDQVRLTRWDRAGCIVSTAVNFVAYPEKLLDFIHRLSLMSDDELGYNPAFTVASQEEVDTLKSLTHVNSYAASLANEILANQRLFPIHKVTCVDLDGKSSSTYYIGKHRTASYSPVGRATRGYVAFRAKPPDGKPPYLCFMKDYWRAISDDIRSELEIYRKLEGVPFVATALGGGDVAGQVTRTDEYLKIDKLLKRQHCIVVIEQLGRPLEDYKTSSHMIVVVYDALRGHKAALEAGVLHRDVSFYNIMILVEQEKEDGSNSPQGMLIDWDLAKFKVDLAQNATQHGRCGTWRFMSALSLQYPYKPNTLADDLESFIHVVTLCSLCFHRHSMTNHYFNEPKLKGLSTEEKNGKNGLLAHHIHCYYDFNFTRGGVCIGGVQKLLQNKHGHPGFSFIAGKKPHEVSPHLITLVDKLYRLLREFYGSVEYSDFEKYSPEDSVEPESPSRLVEADTAVQPLLHRRRQKTRGAQDSSEVPGQASRGKKPLISDVFESHDRILEVFEDVIDAILDDEEAGRFWMDKTDDQFIGLLGYVESRWKE